MRYINLVSSFLNYSFSWDTSKYLVRRNIRIHKRRCTDNAIITNFHVTNNYTIGIYYNIISNFGVTSSPSTNCYMLIYLTISTYTNLFRDNYP